MKAGIRLTDAELDTAYGALRRGATLAAAAETVGTTVQTLCRHIRANGGRETLGIPAALPGPTQTHLVADVIKHLLAGAALATLAQTLGMAHLSLYGRIRIFRANGWLPSDFQAFDPKRTKDTRHDVRIRQMAGERMSLEAIAARLVVPLAFVVVRHEAIQAPADAPDDVRAKGALLSERKIAALYAGRTYGAAA